MGRKITVEILLQVMLESAEGWRVVEGFLVCVMRTKRGKKAGQTNHKNTGYTEWTRTYEKLGRAQDHVRQDECSEKQCGNTVPVTTNREVEKR